MDDGSTDDTASVVNEFKDERIFYFRQVNQGQLRALNNLSPMIKGDLVMLLHSDDLLYEPASLEKNLKYFEDSSLDGIYSSIIRFYTSGKPDDTFPILKKTGQNTPKKLLALLGSNIISDPFFIRKEKFFSHVKTNYLEWNVQYWLDFKSKKATCLKLKYSEYPWYYYRIYGSNYSNSAIGNFETFFGRLRSVFFLSDYYSVLFPSVQKEMMRRFGLGFAIHVPASNRHFGEIIKLLIRSMKQRNPEAYTWFFDQLFCFYNYKGKRVIELKGEISAAYSGADSRKFFNDLTGGSLPPIYKELLSKLNEGFAVIKVEHEQEKAELQKILTFLCIRAAITCSRKPEINN